MPKTSRPIALDDVAPVSGGSSDEDCGDTPACPGCDVTYIADIAIDVIATSCDGDTKRMRAMWYAVNDEVRRLLMPPRPRI